MSCLTHCKWRYTDSYWDSSKRLSLEPSQQSPALLFILIACSAFTTSSSLVSEGASGRNCTHSPLIQFRASALAEPTSVHSDVADEDDASNSASTCFLYRSHQTMRGDGAVAVAIAILKAMAQFCP
ncbi:hypothetical protein TcWFU_002814 [Taenia crassiceps]|uniref:Uncharacterized protein n=1 Tax=Taenia crassiceps TaxID=6207 RepID=A0ABR4Q7U4_9CEST